MWCRRAREMTLRLPGGGGVGGRGGRVGARERESRGECRQSSQFSRCGEAVVEGVWYSHLCGVSCPRALYSLQPLLALSLLRANSRKISTKQPLYRIAH
ncbi:hypothetical protein E2C01_057523 [Portunus trituberculatus]|uniref:Uncharacterized protein n=1 Tax=Portunus trituberculatus TaxID=210409 RepID=A0A5B7H1B1_PORTR|nr:hypothetical protein [Portunus trituberculatus]